MKNLIQLAYGLTVRAQDDATRSIDVIASSEAIDGYGEIVVQDWDLKRYKQNPVVLYGHNSWGFPIGHASNVRVEDNKLLATLNFVDARANPQAEQVWQGILQGSLRAVSVGFRSQAAKATEVDGKTVFMLAGNELLEISVVPIPANPEAVAIAAKNLDIVRTLAGATDNKGNAPPQETKTMSMILKTLIAVLCMPSTSSEDDVAAEVTRVKSAERELLDITGKESVGEALGAVRGFKQGSEQASKLRTEKVELEQKLEKRDRDDLIKRARSNGQLSPAQVAWAESCPIDALRGFVETAPAIPQFKAAPTEPTTTTNAMTHKGKTWSELSPSEKHDLYTTNKALYDAMKEEARKAA